MTHGQEFQDPIVPSHSPSVSTSLVGSRLVGMPACPASESRPAGGHQPDVAGAGWRLVCLEAGGYWMVAVPMTQMSRGVVLRRRVKGHSRARVISCDLGLCLRHLQVAARLIMRAAQQ
ncbi:hypothetical protein BDV06DRAFT_132988 [Aspergillus oleicola]